MPARLSCASSSLNPKGSMRCKLVQVAAHKRATLPVLGAISGSRRTMCMLRFLVEYLPQNQAMCRGSHSCQLAVFFCQQFAHGFRRVLSKAYLNKCSNNSSTHLVEKPIAFDDEGQQWAGFPDITAPQCSYMRAFLVTRVGGKTPEIMLANKARGGAPHSIQLQQTRDVPGRMAD